MALNPSSSYPSNIDITSDPAGYPYGKARNISAPSAGDGTPWEELIVNDLFGFQQALLAAASITPSGVPDKVGASEYLTALQTLFEAAFLKKSAFNKNFGVNAAEIAEIASALAVSSIVETDGSGKLITATKNTGYNKNVGTIAGTVAAGDDARFGAITSALNTDDVFLVNEEQASGVAAGGSVAAIWNVRSLNTSKRNTVTGASVGSNQITLPDGDYWIIGGAPCFSNTAKIDHKVRLRNITDAVDEIIGTSAVTDFDGTGGNQTDSFLMGFITVSGGPKFYELQHYTSGTNATNGLGLPTAAGVAEVYSRIAIFKVG